MTTRIFCRDLWTTTDHSQLNFESWVSGVGSLVAVHKAASQRYIVPPDRRDWTERKERFSYSDLK